MIRQRVAPFLVCFIVMAFFSCAHKEISPTQPITTTVIAPTPAVPGPAPSALRPKPATIAVVFGAGASKGFAHIGVLKVLEANKIPIHMVVGTSAGSVVGSLYAYGYDAFALQNLAMKIEKSDVVDMTIPNNGFIKGEKLEQFINRTVKNTPIEKLKIRFYAVTTDVSTGNEFVCAIGNTGTAVRASCSIPGVFQPVRIGARTFVDGGVVSPVAVEAARRYGADVVIAIDISGGVAGAVPQSTMDTILQSIDIMYSKISAYQLSKADIVIRPKVGGIGSTDLDKRHEAILEGEKAATEAMPAILKIMAKLKQEGRI
jgi:NTE family protein